MPSFSSNSLTFRFRIGRPDIDEWRGTVIVSELQNHFECHSDFPRTLCPDSWRWYSTRPDDPKPKQVVHIPLGSWLLARLTFLLGEQNASDYIRIDEDEYRMDLDVVSDSSEQMGCITVFSDLNQIRTVGQTHLASQPDTVISALCDALCCRPDDLAVCRLEIADGVVGWDGCSFYGAHVRPSRFATFAQRDVHQQIEDLSTRSVTFPRMDDESFAESKETVHSIIQYLRTEGDGDSLDAEDLHFLRSARVEASAYWIWKYLERDGTVCYVTISDGPNGICLGTSDSYGLSPEQYIYGDHKGWL